MNKAETLKNSLLGLAALAMVGALVFLYDKTQAVDLRERNEILGFLRELKEIDGRWDVDVLRARLESSANELPVINRTPAAVKSLQQLNSALQNTPSATLNAWLPELSKAILQKADLVEKFKAENAGTKAGLDALLRQAAELGEQSAQLKPRQPAVDAALNRLTTAAPSYYWLAQDAQRRNLEAALTDLQNAAAALPDARRGRGTA
jgi:two-component system NtrC family sensor kinase